jgi:hypothetical protein
MARGELGVAESPRGRKPARLRQASGPHWAASANGGRRPAGPLGLSWAMWEWGDRSGWPGRARLPAKFRPTARIKLKIPFLFSKSFYNSQTNLNSIQI